MLATADVPLDVAPEAGRHGEIADAADAAKVAEESLKKIEPSREEITRASEEARARLVEARSGNGKASTIEPLEAHLATLETDATKWARKVARARAKSDQANSEAEE